MTLDDTGNGTRYTCNVNQPYEISRRKKNTLTGSGKVRSSLVISPVKNCVSFLTGMSPKNIFIIHFLTAAASLFQIAFANDA